MRDTFQYILTAVYPWLNKSTRRTLFSAMRLQETKASFWKGRRLATAAFIYFTAWGVGTAKRYKKSGPYLMVCKIAIDRIEELLDR
jgi:hypothetical protein